MNSGSASPLEAGGTRALVLATGAMMVSFLAWALIGGLPGLGVSAVLMVACLALYGFVRRVDRERTH